MSIPNCEPPDLGLRDRVALVTGAGAGIGAATARALAKYGARVALCDINIQAVEDVASELVNPAKHLVLPADLAEVELCRRVVSETVNHYGRIDILANVAGYLKRMSFLDVDEKDFDRSIDVNLKSQFFLCQAVIPIMQRQKWGRIINFSSSAGFIGGIHGSYHYGVAKGGVVPLTRSLARDFARDNIFSNIVCPAGTDTAMLRSGMTNEALEKVATSSPVGRLAQAEEMANAVVYLSSRLSSFANGLVLTVDGGVTMHP